MRNRWRLRVMKDLLADQPRSLGDGVPPLEQADPFESPNAQRSETRPARAGLSLGRW